MAGFAKFLLSVLNVLSRTHGYAKKAVDLLRAHASEKSGGKPENLPLDIPGGLLYNTKAVKKKTLQKDAEEPAPGLETIMAKDLHITFPLDCYGDMLTDKQREVVECYYNEDLSLAEIAEVKGITRQGVRDAIKRAEQQLLEMEERLGQLPNRKEQKAYIRQVYHEIKEEYTPILKRMTRTEGRVLLKLIDRETEYTAYEVLREFRGGFVAGFWQGVWRIFGQNLKSEYDAEGEDRMIEQIIIYYEAGLP